MKKYTFVGWYKGEDLVESDATYTFTAEEDLTLEAKYAKKNNSSLLALIAAAANKKYTVSFNTVGGSKVASQNVKKNEPAFMPAAPTKGSEVFAGWYSNAAYTNKFDFGTPITKDTTLFAKWVTKDQCIVMTIDSTDATVFGAAAKTDVAPIIVNDRTMLPARFVAEALGANVAWDAASRKATITGNGVTIEIYIDSATAYVNGKAVTLDSPAFIRGDRTYTPVRFVAEALGATVTWNAADRQALIAR